MGLPWHQPTKLGGIVCIILVKGHAYILTRALRTSKLY